MSALHLAVALDGAGWHPAAWRAPGARPGDLFTAGYWADQVAEAERGLLDFVTIEDSLGPQADPLTPPICRRSSRQRENIALKSCVLTWLVAGVLRFSHCSAGGMRRLSRPGSRR